MKPNYFRRIVPAGLMFAAALAVVSTAKADNWDKRTVLTFREAVETPGVVLPPGTYVFRLLGSQSDRDIVQILNERENQVYNTVLAIPDYRNEPTGHTVMTFEERVAGSPQAIKTWFYPGDLWGDEFVYPKVHPVPAVKIASAPPAAAIPAPVVAPPVAKAPPAPAPKPVEMAKAAPAPVTAPAAPPAPQPPATELPKTASEMPLIGLLGSLCTIAGVILNRRAAA